MVDPLCFGQCFWFALPSELSVACESTCVCRSLFSFLVFAEYGSEANQDVGQIFNIGLRQNFDASSQNQDQDDNIILFSCTSGSNKKIRSFGNQAKIVTYEDCRFNQGQGILQNTGEFVAKSEGIYDFSATFLMKTDYDGAVNVQLMREDVS